MTDRVWSAPALSLLDTMIGLDTHMGVMRRRLQSLLGFYPDAAEVRAMADRHKEKPQRPVPVAANSPGIVAPPVSVDFRFVPPPTPDNAVRLVKSGTYRARGFTMLGGRLR